MSVPRVSIAVAFALSLAACAPSAGPVEPSQPLTSSGIVGWTNVERNQNGALPALAADPVLDAIALERVRDMADKQYFAHVSPNGDSAESVAVARGYSYIIIGENIALGSFRDDDDLVRQWMDSPTHRANILHAAYTHMGAAAIRASYEGEEQWFAVQIFAVPASACGDPDEETEVHIKRMQDEVGRLSDDAHAQSDAIDAMPPSPAKRAKIEVYNESVRAIHEKEGELVRLIDRYNEGLKTRSECMGAIQEL